MEWDFEAAISRLILGLNNVITELPKRVCLATLDDL